MWKRRVSSAPTGLGQVIPTRTPHKRRESAEPTSRWLVLVLGVAFAQLLSACASHETPRDFTTGAEQRDPRGIVFIEHHIAGLRVLETVVGGDGHVPFDTRLPVIVSIHGRGDHARLPGSHFAGIREPVRVLLPEAPDPLGDGFTWSPVSVTENRTPVLAAALALNADRIAGVLKVVIASRPVEGRPIVTGFSQGGMLAYTLAVRHPSLVGTAVPVAGWIPRELLPRRMPRHVELPVIDAVHGTADPIVRIGPTRRSVRRLRSLGFAVDLFEVEGVRHVYADSIALAVHDRLARAIDAASPVACDPVATP
jgi:phospholipase/carboxylesterase